HHGRRPPAVPGLPAHHPVSGRVRRGHRAGREHARRRPARRARPAHGEIDLTVTAALELAHLTVALPGGGERPYAVRDLSFTVDRGEIVCLVGESGSGKSVTAQTVMGLLPRSLRPTGGAVRLEGEDILFAPDARLRDLRTTRMSMIFQEPMTALNPV